MHVPENRSPAPFGPFHGPPWPHSPPPEVPVSFGTPQPRPAPPSDGELFLGVSKERGREELPSLNMPTSDPPDDANYPVERPEPPVPPQLPDNPGETEDARQQPPASKDRTRPPILPPSALGQPSGEGDQGSASPHQPTNSDPGDPPQPAQAEGSETVSRADTVNRIIDTARSPTRMLVLRALALDPERDWTYPALGQEFAQFHGDVPAIQPRHDSTEAVYSLAREGLVRITEEVEGEIMVRGEEDVSQIAHDTTSVLLEWQHRHPELPLRSITLGTRVPLPTGSKRGTASLRLDILGQIAETGMRQQDIAQALEETRYRVNEEVSKLRDAGVVDVTVESDETGGDVTTVAVNERYQQPIADLLHRVDILRSGDEPALQELKQRSQLLLADPRVTGRLIEIDREWMKTKALGALNEYFAAQPYADTIEHAAQSLIDSHVSNVTSSDLKSVLHSLAQARVHRNESFLSEGVDTTVDRLSDLISKRRLPSGIYERRSFEHTLRGLIETLDHNFPDWWRYASEEITIFPHEFNVRQVISRNGLAPFGQERLEELDQATRSIEIGYYRRGLSEDATPENRAALLDILFSDGEQGLDELVTMVQKQHPLLNGLRRAEGDDYWMRELMNKRIVSAQAELDDELAHMSGLPASEMADRMASYHERKERLETTLSELNELRLF